METTTYTYEDPTGAGDNIKLVLPDIWEPPLELKIRDKSGDPYFFGLVEDDG